VHYSALIMETTALSDRDPDSPGIDPIAGALGQRLRAARLDRTWTLDELAAASGVSRRMIVTIEAGRANATLGTLVRLAAAVSEQRTLWRGPAGGSGVLISHARTPDALELWHWHLKPGEEYTSEAHTPGTYELIAVTRGRLLLTVGDEEVVLTSGASFRADAPHAYRNTTRRPVDFTMTVFEPIGRTRP
jgi:transcriptional regulator with XRE-family HTH domain